MLTIRKLSLLIAVMLYSCSPKPESVATDEPDQRTPILIDTDANNELDDQHALAYALSSRDVFSIVGITVNNTRYGNGIQGHYDEAERILMLYNQKDSIPLFRGATGSYSDIVAHSGEPRFDGYEAVDFIISEARKPRAQKLVLVPVGKLTNIALALKKAPDLKDRVRVVWLGSNYPEPGEYNLENDTTAVNPVLESGVPLEIVVVRYGLGTGSHEVSVSREMVNDKMKGKGVRANTPVTGRHGESFLTFGDYSINLFSHIELHGNPPSRALYDMVALAIVKNPAWGKKERMPPSRLHGIRWEPSNSANENVHIWEKFDKESILTDFFKSMDNPKARPR